MCVSITPIIFFFNCVCVFCSDNHKKKFPLCVVVYASIMSSPPKRTTPDNSSGSGKRFKPDHGLGEHEQIELNEVNERQREVDQLQHELNEKKKQLETLLKKMAERHDAQTMVKDGIHNKAQLSRALDLYLRSSRGSLELQRAIEKFVQRRSFIVALKSSHTPFEDSSIFDWVREWTPFEADLKEVLNVCMTDRATYCAAARQFGIEFAKQNFEAADFLDLKCANICWLYGVESLPEAACSELKSSDVIDVLGVVGNETVARVERTGSVFYPIWLRESCGAPSSRKACDAPRPGRYLVDGDSSDVSSQEPITGANVIGTSYKAFRLVREDQSAAYADRVLAEFTL